MTSRKGAEDAEGRGKKGRGEWGMYLTYLSQNKFPTLSVYDRVNVV